MGLMEEFNRAKQWIVEKFNIKEATNELSVFETTIRFVGGFLTAFALSKDQV
jgi:hypothetical protein